VNVFALALAGHLVGDWLVQTDWQAANKTWPQPFSDEDQAEVRRVHGDARGAAISWAESRAWWRSVRALEAHMVSYHAVLAVFVAPWWHDRWALFALAVSWLTHQFIDRRWPVRWLLSHTGSRAFAEQTWGVLVTDQALHITIVALLTAAVRS
jgi:hypothetical protein